MISTRTCACIIVFLISTKSYYFFTLLALTAHMINLVPRLLQSADENLNFEEQILEAAKNIAGATSALVKSATAAQRELVAQGKLSSNPQSEDGQWSDGLVSAVSFRVTITVIQL
jgi:hypothetical protein